MMMAAPIIVAIDGTSIVAIDGTSPNTDGSRWCVVDGTGPPEIVAARVEAAVQERLGVAR